MVIIIFLGRKTAEFNSANPDDTIETLIDLIAEGKGVNPHNWGFYLKDSKREFMENNIKINSLCKDSVLYFLPRTIIR
jgi:hypothetical protein